MIDLLTSAGTDVWNTVGNFATMVNQLKNNIAAPAFMLVAAVVGVTLAFKKEVRGALVAVVVFIVAGVFVFAPSFFQTTSTNVGEKTDLSW